ncbi:glycosyl hydrolase family 43 [Kineococcus xinjiangensis]|uniref:Glycosyl hydrolase family 43 n=1 Tax=Kineococcus xinjiangensis TaxID=512762 RepID=A0A2S6IWX6_9ACTN|nr:glycoside hydrolase family 43 protein [Kineococcus xinjiangensis]PPK98740.1 glycosyl hydrolase family 43 [Kineococcus xinjiangensis]
MITPRSTTAPAAPHRRGRLRRALATAVSAAVLAGAGLAATTQPAAAAGPVPHYLMTAFTNSSESNMYVYDSGNAANFDLVRANAYTPPSGLVRDPSVLRHSDGYYYLVYTTGWTGNTIGFARSADTRTWTFLRNVTVNVAGTSGSTWAPEWFRDSDGSVHVIMSISTTGTNGQFRPYRITATNSALSTWSAPAALGIPANYIDSFVVKVGGTYHNFLKNETTKYIEHATATSLSGPWTFRGTGNWAGWGSGLEGPALVRMADGRWRIYFDQYGARRYFYADSADLSTFSPKVELAGLSGHARHFTVLREDVGDGTAVPTGNRSLRSANFPDRFVRHRDYKAVIDPLSASSPSADRRDATFSVVPGLANGACSSFQAVNFPGYYLRHENFKLVLARSDGSAGFRGDATFCARAGFAGNGTTSFESYNVPGRFVRHSNYVLQLDLRQNTSVFNGDASFAVTAPLG